MSVGVTEPNSRPRGPALRSKRSSTPPSFAAISWACSSVVRLVAGAVLLALLVLGEERGRRRLRELARLEVVAHVPARDVHDVAAQADLLDVLQEDDFH